MRALIFVLPTGWVYLRGGYSVLESFLIVDVLVLTFTRNCGSQVVLPRCQCIKNLMLKPSKSRPIPICAKWQDREAYVFLWLNW
jgi:hypothetical protein